MPAYRGRGRRCPHCHKGLYRTYRIAHHAMMRLPVRGRVYWHPEGGGYCITSIDSSEYDRRRAGAIDTPPGV